MAAFFLAITLGAHSNADMNTQIATLIGFFAVLLWALLAVLTVGTAPVPPFQLNAMCFSIAGTIGVVWTIWTHKWHLLRAVPLSAYAFGTAGLFGYHALYFAALRLAPPAEAGLIAYLWPLFIVLFSGLLPGERIKPLHILGACVAFLGAALILKDGASFSKANSLGYMLAFCCALTWSGYSVLSRRFKGVPSVAVTVFCLAAAALSTVAHVLVEDTVWPATTANWLSVLALGAGPVGLAFYVWDVGVKFGNIQLLGTASYAAPLLSTLALVATGMTEPRAVLWGAAGLITLGAALAALGSRQNR